MDCAACVFVDFAMMLLTAGAAILADATLIIGRFFSAEGSLPAKKIVSEAPLLDAVTMTGFR